MEGRRGIARVDGPVRLLRGRRQHIAGDSSRRLRPAGTATVAPTTTAGTFTTWPTSYHFGVARGRALGGRPEAERKGAAARGVTGYGDS